MTAPEHYRWIYDNHLGEAACVTLVSGGDVDAVLRTFGADPSRPSTRDDVDRAQEEAGDDYERWPSFVSVTGVPGGVVVVEDNGTAGAEEDLVARLSRGGTAASIFWNVEQDNAFTCARDGELLAQVDMYDAEVADETDLPDELRPLFEALGPVLASEEDVPDEDYLGIEATGLAMAVLFTGVQVRAEHVPDEPAISYRLPDR